MLYLTSGELAELWRQMTPFSSAIFNERRTVNVAHLQRDW